jgi:hypothetical protein
MTDQLFRTICICPICCWSVGKNSSTMNVDIICKYTRHFVKRAHAENQPGEKGYTVNAARYLYRPNIVDYYSQLSLV